MRTSLFPTLALVAFALVSTACPTGEGHHRELSQQAVEEAKSRQGPAPVASPEKSTESETVAGEAVGTVTGQEPMGGTEAASQGRHRRRPHPDAGTSTEPGTPDAGSQGGPTPGPVTGGTDGHPAPQGCVNRPPDVTEMDAQVRVDQYKGIQHGRNGDHEIFEGTITNILWTTRGKVVTTRNVHVAMNVASPTDKAGLPREIPLNAGDVVELTGEYIPSSKANASNANGPAAVLHFTHSPCGYAVIGGQKYQ